MIKATPFAVVLLLAVLIIFAEIINAEESSDSAAVKSPIEVISDGMSFSGQWFLAYDMEDSDDESSNEFRLKRGYVTIKKKFNQSLSTRVTQDIAVDQEGDGEGDIEIRLKYLYIKYAFGAFSIFHDMYFEFGLVHRPWLDFEQKINPYRVQGTMFIERYGIVKSADYGITFGTLLGGKIDKEYQNKVNNSYPGRYGSLVFGVYNGGGYEAVEKNENKLLEGRLSLRPFPDVIPGIQLSVVGGYGKSNTEAAPDYSFLAGFATLETERLIVTSMYYNGVGDLDGDMVDENGNSVDQDGYSVFFELKYPFEDFALFARYDRFNSDYVETDWYKQRFIVGISCYFYKNSKVLLDYDHLEVNDGSVVKEHFIELAVEIRY